MGDKVKVQKIEPTNANKINVVPINKVPKGSEQYLHDFMEGHAITTSDKISLPYFDTTLDYRVRKIIPNAEYALVSRETAFHIDVAL
ncbi:MAG: hypothetical protein KGI25_04955 [Thaumarchaeota archaeon]|nr:hypothetical protein [Nitrososphaerota archaeon]